MKELVLNVDGMMCEGCENRVKNALSQIAGVESVNANHKEKTVKVTLTQDLDKNILIEKIEDIGFEVVNN